MRFQQQLTQITGTVTVAGTTSISGNVVTVPNNGTVVENHTYNPTASGSPFTYADIATTLYNSFLLTIDATGSTKHLKVEIIWLTAIAGSAQSIDTFYVGAGRYLGQIVPVKSLAYRLRVTSQTGFGVGDNFVVFIYGLSQSLGPMGFPAGLVGSKPIWQGTQLLAIGASNATFQPAYDYTGPVTIWALLFSSSTTPVNSAILAINDLDQNDVSQNQGFRITSFANGLTGALDVNAEHVWLNHWKHTLQLFNQDTASAHTFTWCITPEF